MSEQSLWLVFAAVIGTFLAIDLFLVQRRQARPRMRTSLAWVGLWIALGLGFGGLVLWARGGQAAGEYLAGYLIEYSLSVDNIFVFAMLFTYFAVPEEHQRRLLFWGVIGAIIFRAAFVVGGIALIHLFEPIVYVFGAILVLTGVRLARSVDEGASPESNAIIRLVRRFLPMAEGQQDGAFVVRRGGRWLATPLLAALVTIELSDVIFAIDSVPAILSITTNAFIVLTSNAFAILGLRSLYFVLSGLLERFHYLRYGLAAILVFAGTKMLLANFVEIPIAVSLAVIVSLIAGSLAASLVMTRRASSDTGNLDDHEAQVEDIERTADQEVPAAQ